MQAAKASDASQLLAVAAQVLVSQDQAVWSEECQKMRKQEDLLTAALVERWERSQKGALQGKGQDQKGQGQGGGGSCPKIRTELVCFP